MPLAPGIGGTPLSSANPQATGIAAPGTSGLVSRADHVHFSAGGGGGISQVTTFLQADVSISAVANTWTNILTSTLGGAPSGKKLQVSAHVLLLGNLTDGGSTVDLFDGTNVLAETETNVTITGTGNTTEVNFPPIDLQPGSNITLQLRFTSKSTGATTLAKAAALNNSGGNFATWLTYMIYG